MEVAIMPNYVEMIRLFEAGFSLRQIDYYAPSGPPIHSLESLDIQLIIADQ